jgi:hypothetical protein
MHHKTHHTDRVISQITAEGRQNCKLGGLLRRGILPQHIGKYTEQHPGRFRIRKGRQD